MNLKLMLKLARMEVSSLYHLLGLLGDIVPGQVRAKVNASIVDIQPLLNNINMQNLDKEEILKARVTISNAISDVLESVSPPLMMHVLRSKKIVADKLNKIDTLPVEKYRQMDQDWLLSLENKDDYLEDILNNNKLSQLLSKIKIDLFLHSREIEAKIVSMSELEGLCHDAIVLNVGVRSNIIIPLSALLAQLIRPAPSEKEEIIDFEDTVIADVIRPNLTEMEVQLSLARIEKIHFEQLIDELDIAAFLNVGNHDCLFDRFYELVEPLQENSLFTSQEPSLEEIKAIRSGMKALYQDYMQALKAVIKPLLPKKLKAIQVAFSDLESAKSFIRQEDLAGDLSYPRPDYSISPYTAIHEAQQSLCELESMCQQLMRDSKHSIVSLCSSLWELLILRENSWINSPNRDLVEGQLRYYEDRLSFSIKKIQGLCQEFLGAELSSKIYQQSLVARELFEATYPLQKINTPKACIPAILQGNSLFNASGKIEGRKSSAKRKSPDFDQDGDLDPVLKKPFSINNDLDSQSEAVRSINKPS